MNETQPHDENMLSAQLEQAQTNVERLEVQLRTIDAELEQHADERQQFQLLHEVCSGLEKLRELGAEDLFWGGVPSDARGEAHTGIVRHRVDEFDQRLAKIESRRQAVLSKIRDEQENAEFIVDDIYQAQLEEEARKREWLVERELDLQSERNTVMPWARGGEDDERFRKTLALSLLLSLFFGLVFPWIGIPLPDPWKPIDVPERLTRLLKEEPPPPIPKPLELKPTQTKSESSDDPVVAEKKTPEPEARPEPKVTPRKKAESTGILAFREKFSGLAENKAAARLGAQARINHVAERPGQGAVRSMVATRAAGTSGGLDLAAVSRDIGGGGGEIEGLEVGQATSGIGDIVGNERPLSGGPGPARTDEEIQIVFDRHKAALYRLYNRELRRDPTLKGQIVLRFQIEPDGSVSLCEVHSTDMNAPNLAKQVVGRVKTFDFGAKEGVPPVLIRYPIDFLPAT
ncbi:MAG: AgmX/PglI C-terminal domain-containing protein [bacterium]|nr:AgmX/PglI C-terminal domain-containing protein [bacterium]